MIHTGVSCYCSTSGDLQETCRKTTPHLFSSFSPPSFQSPFHFSPPLIYQSSSPLLSQYSSFLPSPLSLNSLLPSPIVCHFNVNLPTLLPPSPSQTNVTPVSAPLLNQSLFFLLFYFSPPFLQHFPLLFPYPWESWWMQQQQDCGCGVPSPDPSSTLSSRSHHPPLKSSSSAQELLQTQMHLMFTSTTARPRVALGIHRHQLCQGKFTACTHADNTIVFCGAHLTTHKLCDFRFFFLMSLWS